MSVIIGAIVGAIRRYALRMTARIFGIGGFDDE